MDFNDKKYFLLINGINTSATDQTGWHFVMEDLIENLSPWQANTYHYHVRTTTRWTKQNFHIEQAMLKMGRRSKPDERIILVGHSNGCAVICGMLQKLAALKATQERNTGPETSLSSEYRVAEIHLIAAAVDDDFNKNGLNEAVDCGLVGRIVLYTSPDDRALMWAKRTHWINWLNSRWGYGHMGLSGPKNVSDLAETRTVVHRFPGYDHGTYFTTENMGLTARIVMDGGILPEATPAPEGVLVGGDLPPPSDE